MSPFCIELSRPGEDGLSIYLDDFTAMVRGTRPCDILATLGWLDGIDKSAVVSAEQATALADSLDTDLQAGTLAQVWNRFGDDAAEMVKELAAFLRRGEFRLTREALH